jgi:hypothetical protein
MCKYSFFYLSVFLLVVQYSVSQIPCYLVGAKMALKMV